MLILYFAVLLAAFALLFKCADFFVDGASEIALILNIPKLIIGIFLVGLATTAPEFGVSVFASFLGKPEIALGNAIGSVICDDGIALALAAVLAPAAIMVNCRMLKIVGVFLLFIDFFAYLLARNGTLGRIEGASLLGLLVVYFFLIFKNPDFGLKTDAEGDIPSHHKRRNAFRSQKSQLRRPVTLFLFGLIGVVLTSRGIVWAAERIALYFSVSDIVIGATVVAIGTSLPEISTCITAALKGEGEIAVGNIIGADVLNVLWIIGVSSIVRPINVDLDIINFAFPFMILVVTVMLVGMRIGCRLGKITGVLLFLLYILYLFLTLSFFA
ncbi:MAG: calcium/sodium antiporter [Candidatus Aminicenantes bacterium]|nr:calcium/sodium antiporter [Candidatus Aminicenantes bacterium]